MLWAGGRKGPDSLGRPPNATQQALYDCIRQAAGSGAGLGTEADQLARLSEIRARGDSTDDEFRRAKEKILH